MEVKSTSTAILISPVKDHSLVISSNLAKQKKSRIYLCREKLPMLLPHPSWSVASRHSTLCFNAWLETSPTVFLCVSASEELISTELQKIDNGVKKNSNCQDEQDPCSTLYTSSFCCTSGMH